MGGAKYSVSIPVRSPADEEETMALFLVWLWYAARRANLHLDGDLTDDYNTPTRLEASLRQIAPVLHIAPDDAVVLAPRTSLERYGAGETIQRPGVVPDGLRVVVNGRAALTTPFEDEADLRVAQLTDMDMLGLTAITREPAATSCVALTDVTTVLLPVDALDELIKARPALARDIGKSLDNRRRLAREAVAAVTIASPRGVSA